MRGPYVSGTNIREAIPKAEASIRVTHAVHRQPRWESTMKPPTIGPKIGPIKAAAAYTETATPRSLGLKISAKTPGVTAIAAVPKKPMKNRQMRMVCRFCAVATGIWKMQKTAYPE